MDLAQFCAASRVVVVAGKGGVGKTTVAATLATAAARAGLSVLVVEVEGKSGLTACFGMPDLGYEDTIVEPGLAVRALDADSALVEWLDGRGLQRISHRLARTGTLDVVATAVPGMRDILLLAKIKQLEQAGAADLIVVDAPAAGHAISFLLAPKGLQDAVGMGVIRTQADEVAALLADPARCQVMLVTLPEETPVNEVVETAYALEDRVGVALGPVVVNQCLPERWTAGGGGPAVAADVARAGVPLSAADLSALTAADAFVGTRRATEREQVERLGKRLPLPRIHLPFQTGEVGPEAVSDLAAAFTAQVAGLRAPDVVEDGA